MEIEERIQAQLSKMVLAEKDRSVESNGLLCGRQRKYLDTPIEPLYPFGYGLSYTRYEYADLQAVAKETAVVVSVVVTNTGSCNGEETVQCYSRDPVASLVRPVKKLVAFEEIALETGESKTVRFTLPMKTFGFYDNNMNFVVESGTIQIMVGRDSSDVLTQDIEI